MGQVNGTCEVKEERMKKYLEKVLQLVKKFKETNFVQISRKENMEADTLAKEASADQPMNEFTPSHNDLEVVEDKKWIIHVDGLSTQHAGGIRVVL